MEVELANGTIGELEGRVEAIEVLLVEADIFELEVPTKEIDGKLIFMDAVDEGPEVSQDDLFNHCLHYEQSNRIIYKNTCPTSNLFASQALYPITPNMSHPTPIITTHRIESIEYSVIAITR